jgi:hypothetical protein
MIRLFAYLHGCNIDLELALEDIGMAPGAFTMEDLEGAGAARCTGCSAWYGTAELVDGRCSECRA